MALKEAQPTPLSPTAGVCSKLTRFDTRNSQQGPESKHLIHGTCYLSQMGGSDIPPKRLDEDRMYSPGIIAWQTYATEDTCENKRKLQKMRNIMISICKKANSFDPQPISLLFFQTISWQYLSGIFTGSPIFPFYIRNFDNLRFFLYCPGARIDISILNSECKHFSQSYRAFFRALSSDNFFVTNRGLIFTVRSEECQNPIERRLVLYNSSAIDRP